MRITKFLIIAAIATMAMSCAHNFEATPTQEAEIGFGSWAEHLTKANVQFANGSQFYVYGCKTVNAQPQVVFQNTTVTKENDVWVYSPKRFWDNNASQYTFYAVSAASNPTADANHSSSATDGNLGSQSINFYGNNNESNNNDILVAEKTVVAKGENSFNNHAAVNLLFHHIGALVDVKVKKTATLANSTVAITHVALLNIQNAGTYTITYSDGSNVDEFENPISANEPIATWTRTSAVSFTTENNPEQGRIAFPQGIATCPNDVVQSNCTNGDHTTSGSNMISNLIVMPQTLSPQSNLPTLEIGYTISTEISSGVYDVITVPNAQIRFNQFDKTDFDEPTTNSNEAPFITSWAQGKHYIYYLTIDANAISFTAEIVDWTTVNGYHYLVN